ncbi:MAG: sugar phosphate isomerase/epimerase [Clostridia bacterium]|nr:sugar phosphate isomerase/epimerase [Clostridia bacterium]
MKLGLQLFSLIDIMNKPDGLRTVMKIAADAGYEGVEFAGFYGLSADEVVEELKKNNLVTAGIHLGWDNMNRENLISNPADVIGTAKKLGAHSVTFASYGGKTKEEWLAFAKEINEFGKMFADAGILLGYHNHRHEFQKFDDQYIIDILLENCDPKNVFWELDPRHIVIAGVDPVEFAAKYSGRVPVLHMRDIEKLTGPDTADDTAVGSGIVDIPGVVKASGAHDWLVVEEGPGSNNLEHIKMSADYIKKTFLA